MAKTQFESAELQIIDLERQDVITASPTEGTIKQPEGVYPDLGDSFLPDAN